MVEPTPKVKSDRWRVGQEARWWRRAARAVLGAPRRLRDRSLFRHLALVPFLAWVGLGGDGLSSSAYGPDEAFRALGPHGYLALPLAVAVAATVALISGCYMQVIERFPSGGGAYVVATRLIGPRVGVVAASALVVDYVLTITVSVAAGADALLSFFPGHVDAKVPIAAAAIALLIVMNVRGLKESVTVLVPIFLLFVAMHLGLIVMGVVGNVGQTSAVLASSVSAAARDFGTIGALGMLALLARAYSMGAGTFTGIEAVSNGLPVLREPRVENGKRTMIYMAGSLAFTAAGILICYLLAGVIAEPGKTLNAALGEAVFHGGPDGPPLGRAALGLLLASESALLLVAAQTGFVGGPQVMANMAVDSWLPHRFAALSERLTTRNGVLLMGGAAIFFLLVTGGSTHALVVLYSINVFLSFTLSMAGMARAALMDRATGADRWRRRFALQCLGAIVCGAILTVTLYEKFAGGAWLTVLITGGLVATCFLIRRHYRNVAQLLHTLDKDLADIAVTGFGTDREFDPKAPTAVLLVGGFSGFGVHTMLTVLRTFPGHFKQFVFVSVAVVDTGTFKGADQVDALKLQTEGGLQRYVDLARRIGVPATYETGYATEAVSEAERICADVAARCPHAVFFGGKLVFREDRWFQRLLHNETAYAIQRRLQWAGIPMLVLPIRAEPTQVR